MLVRTSLLLLPLLFSACSAVPTRAGRPEGPSDGPLIHNQVVIQFGSKTIDDANDLDVGASETVDIGDQTAIGFEYSSIADGGFGGEFGLQYSSADDDIDFMGTPINLELSLLEITAGARYTFRGLGNFMPYIGGGVDLISYDLSGESGGSSVSTDDTDFGLYAHVGAAYAVGGHFLVGADLRGVFGTSDDLDSTQVSGFLGYGF